MGAGEWQRIARLLALPCFAAGTIDEGKRAGRLGILTHL